MPLGDSITDGLTVPGGYRIGLWQRLVSGGRTVDFVGSLFNGPSSLGDHDHEGHSGWRIDQIDANISNRLSTRTPRTILLHIGTNDMVQNPTNAPARLATLLDHIIAVQARANAGKRVHLVDMFNALTTADLADGVHPNSGGYNKMAAVWYTALQSVPGSLDPPGSPSPSPTVVPPSSPPPSGTCTTTLRDGTRWPDRFNTEVTVSGATNWTVVIALTSPQRFSSAWNASASVSGNLVTLRFNGNGTVFGITTLANGNFTRPQVRSCTAT